MYKLKKLVNAWLRTPPLTEPEENALSALPMVKMMGTVDFSHRRIQHCSVFLRPRQWQAPSVWLGIIASGSDSENSRGGYFQENAGVPVFACSMLHTKVRLKEVCMFPLYR